MYVCNEAVACSVQDCSHKYRHNANKMSSCVLDCCLNEDGVRFAKCEELKEKQVEQKLEGIEVKHTILQNQEKKTDAGKLRYDLIEYGIINKIALQEYNAKELMNLITDMEWDEEYYYCEWIATAIVALGGMSNFLKELARVHTFGAEKYGDLSWKTVPNAKQRYLAAMQRHIFEFQHGNYLNYEDGMLYHIAQVAWNAIALLWLMENREM